MKNSTARELERLLAATPAGEPPRELAERIKSEIPGELPTPAAAEVVPIRTAWHHPHRWRLAAALVMAVGGGAVAWWAWREEPHPGAPAVEQAAAPSQEGAVSAPSFEDSRLRAGRSGGEAPVAPDAQRDLGAAVDEPASRADDERPQAMRRFPAPPARQVPVPAPRPAPDPSASPPAPAEGTETATEAFDERVEVEPDADISFRGGSPRAEREAERARLSQEAPRPQVEEARKQIQERLSELRRVETEPPPAPPAAEPESLLSIPEVPKPKPAQAQARMQAGNAPGYFAGEAAGVQAAPSTGGTDEPDDAAYGDVFFRHYGVNPFLDPEEDKLSTFALDVDTGSWGVVRRYLDGGDRPPAEAVRVEEIVNALDYGDPPPAEGDFALHAEGAPTPFGGGERYRLLRFAIQAREVDVADRKPAALTFVVDVSGSMAQENRLGLVQAALGLLLDELRPDDRVALVTYGSQARVVVRPTADKEALRTAIDALRPEGSTNAEEGLVFGYRVASSALRPGAINRVVLASDGVANVGRTGPDSILATVRAEAARGIELTTLGFGMGNYNDVLMERLADDGDGRYAYIDTLEEARRVLVEELTGTLQTVAEEARAQVEINPEVVERYRLLGYENRDVADERFRDDTVDAGEIGAGHTVTALYEVKLKEQATGRAGVRAYRTAPVATLRLRWRPAGQEAFVETERALTVGELAASWERATPALRLAGLAAEFAELLRGSYWAREGSMETVFRGLQALQPELPGDARAAELAAMAGRAARLGGAPPADPPK